MGKPGIAAAESAPRIPLVHHLVTYLERYYWAVIAAFGVLYFAEEIAVSVSTILTTDEMLAYYTGMRPSLSALFEASRRTALSADAFIYPVISFILLRLVHPLELAMRLPSVVAYFCFMIAVFVFVRRRVNASAGLIAFASALVVPVAQYAHLGRPYAIVLGWAGWVMVCWQAASMRRPRVGWLIGLAVCLVGLLASHYYAGLLYVPLVIGELYRTVQSRRIDVAMWVGLITPTLVMIAYVPFLGAASVYSAHPWHGVLFSDLSETYMMLASAGIILLACATAVFAMLPVRVGARPVPLRFEVYEVAALCALLLLPFAAFGAGVLYTKTYVFRYAISFTIAFAVFAAAVTAKATADRPAAAGVLGLALLAYSQVSLLPKLVHGGRNTEALALRSIESEIFKRYASLPVVVPSFDAYMTVQIYGPDFLKSLIQMICERDDMLRATGTDNPAIAMNYLHRMAGFPLVDYRQFAREHKEFLVYSDYWLREQVLRDGATVELLGSAGPHPVYRVAVRQ